MKDGLKLMDRTWAQDFACEPAQLHTPVPYVQRHAGALADYNGIWMFATDGAPCISVPHDVYPEIANAALRWKTVGRQVVPTIQQDIAALTRRRISDVIGPAYVGVGFAERLQLLDAARAQLLDDKTRDLIVALRAEVTAEEWEHGGSEARGPLFGAFDAGGGLAALAGYEVWNGSIAHISIISRTAERGRGHGRAAVAFATHHALASGLVPQYRTLFSNAPSMGIARRLGFVEYGRSLAVRLVPI